MLYAIKSPIIKKLLTLTLIGVLFASTDLSARKLTHTSGKLELKLHAPMGDIHAVNELLSGTVNTETGQLDYRVVVSGFRFITDQAPEGVNNKTTARFKDYYLETETYPEAVFNGNILDPGKISFDKDGVYSAEVQGSMTIHGETKEIAGTATFEVEGSQVVLRTDFILTIADYKLRVPESVKHIFFKEVQVAVECYLH